MAFLQNQQQLLLVEWGKKYLWDVKFTDAPSPFNDWFPASDVDEGRAFPEVFQFNRFLDGVRVPRRRNTENKSLVLTFFDDADNTLVDWLDDWINRRIFGNGTRTLPVAQAIKKVQIAKLNSQREQISVIAYNVFPVSQIIFNGSSSSDPQSYSIEFAVVGEERRAKREFQENNL